MGCSIRALALAGFLFAFGIVALVALAIEYPNFGTAAGQRYFIGFPPQAVLAFVLGPVAVAFALTVGLRSTVESFERHRWGWSPVFLSLTGVGLLGSALLVIRLFDAHSTPLGEVQDAALALVWGVSLVFLLILGLVFDRRNAPRR
jgi:hypothetical protein